MFDCQQGSEGWDSETAMGLPRGGGLIRCTRAGPGTWAVMFVELMMFYSDSIAMVNHHEKPPFGE